MRLPCFHVVHRAVAHVTLSLWHTHPAMGAWLGGTRVVSQVALLTVEESCAHAMGLCKNK